MRKQFFPWLFMFENNFKYLPISWSYYLFVSLACHFTPSIISNTLDIALYLFSVFFLSTNINSFSKRSASNADCSIYCKVSLLLIVLGVQIYQLFSSFFYCDNYFYHISYFTFIGGTWSVFTFIVSNMVHSTSWID